MEGSGPKAAAHQHHDHGAYSRFNCALDATDHVPAVLIEFPAVLFQSQQSSALNADQIPAITFFFTGPHGSLDEKRDEAQLTASVSSPHVAKVLVC